MNEEGFFSTNNRYIVIMMLTQGLRIEKKCRADRGKMSFFFDKESARPHFEAWQSGEPIPVRDIRDIFQAEVIFNSAIHDEF